MSIAVLIWSSWLVLTSAGQTTALSLADLAVFRALSPSLVLAPPLWHHRLDIIRLGLVRCLCLSAYGAPFIFFVGLGLSHAPVSHAGALVPGLMPVFALALGTVFLARRLGMRQWIAVLLILSGAATTLLHGSDPLGHDDQWRGHALFLTGALCWASFTVTMQSTAVSPFLATAIVGSLSCAGLLPIWFLSDLSNLREASLSDVTFQLLFQGVLSGLLALYAFSRALVFIPDMAGTLSALTPGVATILVIPVLGQVPGLADAFALVLVVAGLAVLASGSSKGIGAPEQTDQAPPSMPPATMRNQKVAR